jgi:hypothetical protein
MLGGYFGKLFILQVSDRMSEEPYLADISMSVVKSPFQPFFLEVFGRSSCNAEHMRVSMCMHCVCLCVYM